MSDAQSPCAACSEYRAEIDRLRLLLQAASKRGNTWSVVMEPSTHGFNLTVTGVKPAEEQRIAVLLADYLNALWRGAFRWTMKLSTLVAEREIDVEHVEKTMQEATEDRGASVDLQRTGVVKHDDEQP